MGVEVGQIVKGTVIKITSFGAFVKIEDGLDGLVHISEVANRYVKDINEHLRIGDEVEAKVVAVKEGGKIDLSIKQLQEPAPRSERRAPQSEEFEKMLKGYMRSADEKHSALKKRREAKKF